MGFLNELLKYNINSIIPFEVKITGQIAQNVRCFVLRQGNSRAKLKTTKSNGLDCNFKKRKFIHIQNSMPNNLIM